MAEDALARARAIAARLGAVASSESNALLQPLICVFCVVVSGGFCGGGVACAVIEVRAVVEACVLCWMCCVRLCCFCVTDDANIRR
jgi:hypothetical protein